VGGYISDKELLESFRFLEDVPHWKNFEDYEGGFKLTPNGIRYSISHNNKTLSVAYLFGLKKINGVNVCTLGRVYTNKNYRGQGLAYRCIESLLSAVDVYDFKIDLVACPNRIDGLTKENMPIYRQKLFDLYGLFGFKRVNSVTGKMVREIERRYNAFYTTQIHED
jgi:hypothetical protein